MNSSMLDCSNKRKTVLFAGAFFFDWPQNSLRVFTLNLTFLLLRGPSFQDLQTSQQQMLSACLVALKTSPHTSCSVLVYFLVFEIMRFNTWMLKNEDYLSRCMGRKQWCIYNYYSWTDRVCSFHFVFNFLALGRPSFAYFF